MSGKRRNGIVNDIMVQNIKFIEKTHVYAAGYLTVGIVTVTAIWEVPGCIRLSCRIDKRLTFGHNNHAEFEHLIATATLNHKNIRATHFTFVAKS
jgi:hypothetical protein